MHSQNTKPIYDSKTFTLDLNTTLNFETRARSSNPKPNP